MFTVHSFIISFTIHSFIHYFATCRDFITPGVCAQALQEPADEDNVATMFTNTDGKLHALTPQLICVPSTSHTARFRFRFRQRQRQRIDQPTK
jgi:hypothetical protein